MFRKCMEGHAQLNQWSTSNNPQTSNIWTLRLETVFSANWKMLMNATQRSLLDLCVKRISLQKRPWPLRESWPTHQLGLAVNHLILQFIAQGAATFLAELRETSSLAWRFAISRCGGRRALVSNLSPKWIELKQVLISVSAYWHCCKIFH